MTATALSINLNKIALLRNSRPGDFPSVTHHAAQCVAAGADGITVHPRPDQRHIRASDCHDLAAILTVELNIEGNPFAAPQASTRPDVSDYPGFMPLIEAVRPAQCTLVPDSGDQLTSDHGFDLERDGDQLAPIVEKLRSWGVRVSVFMDADIGQISLASQLGIDRIELYTGPYAAACKRGDVRAIEAVFNRFRASAEHAAAVGLGLNAGHDLNLQNLTHFASIPQLLEVSIGHAFTVDALELGLANAVQAYQRCLGKG